MSKAKDYLVLPPLDLYTRGGTEYIAGQKEYSNYNYTGNSLIPKVKRRHFETALRLTRNRFGGGAAIDMGCADGFFLPSLSRYFARVYAIDNHQGFCAEAQRVVDELHLQNVTVLCNRDMSWDELTQELPTPQASTLYLLETLEHIGEAERLYESKMEFLHHLFDLLSPDGVVVISVPIMVGPAFLLQRIVLSTFRMYREPISPRQLFRAVVLGNADEMEASWTTWAHLGFNHRKLERFLRKEFVIVERRNLFLTQVYAIRRR